MARLSDAGRDPHSELDPVFLRKRLWLGLTRWTWIRLAFAWIVFAGAATSYAVVQNTRNDAARERRRQEAIVIQERERAAEAVRINCSASNDGRLLLRQVIELSTSQGGTLDLTLVPSYKDQSPEFKRFVIELRDLTAQRQTNPDGLLERGRALTTPRDCAAEVAKVLQPPVVPPEPAP